MMGTLHLNVVALLLGLTGCGFSAATDVTGSDTGAGTLSSTTAGSSSGGSGGGGTSGTTGSSSTTSFVDVDGDGVSPDDGDCDDRDADVFPGQIDTCDGVDSDCDGEIDEDAEDWTEPAEPGAAVELDPPTVDPEQLVEGLLYSDLDVDVYAFELEDHWSSLYTLDITLDNIPTDATYRLTVEPPGGNTAVEYGTGRIGVTFDDEVWDDTDAGWWTVTVDSLGGADCSQSYWLEIVFDDDWF